MKTRAAILWEQNTDWSVEEIDLDPPQAGEVLVKLVGSGLCHSDEHIRDRRHGGSPQVRHSAHVGPGRRGRTRREPGAEVIGPFLASDLPEVIARITSAIAPLLRVAMASGQIATRDPDLLAESLVRLGITLILAPPPGDIDTFLAEILVPTLKPPH